MSYIWLIAIGVVLLLGASYFEEKRHKNKNKREVLLSLLRERLVRMIANGDIDTITWCVEPPLVQDLKDKQTWLCIEGSNYSYYPFFDVASTRASSGKIPESILNIFNSLNEDEMIPLAKATVLFFQENPHIFGDKIFSAKIWQKKYSRLHVAECGSLLPLDP